MGGGYVIQKIYLKAQTQRNLAQAKRVEKRTEYSGFPPSNLSVGGMGVS